MEHDRLFTYSSIYYLSELEFTVLQTIYIVLWSKLQQYPIVQTFKCPPTPLLCLYTSETQNLVFSF